MSGNREPSVQKEEKNQAQAEPHRFVPPVDIQEFAFFDPAAPLTVLDGNLPHWRQESATYFVTFRTVDSLPQEKLRHWLEERDEWRKEHPEPHSGETRSEYWQRFPQRIQNWLDAGYGECLLARPEVRKIMVEALQHFDGQRYQLHSWVVMPNHVHVLVTPTGKHELSEILHSWKSFSSMAIHKLLGRSGAFWQKESFDHIVRTWASVEKVNSYLIANPRGLSEGTYELSANLARGLDALG